MTENSPGSNNIDSLADRAKEMLERVRGPIDDAPTTPVVTAEPSAPTIDADDTDDTDDTIEDVEAEATVDVEPASAPETTIEALSDEPLEALELEDESEASNRLGALADQAKTSLSQVASTDEDHELVDLDIEADVEPIDIEAVDLDIEPVDLDIEPDVEPIDIGSSLDMDIEPVVEPIDIEPVDLDIDLSDLTPTDDAATDDLLTAALDFDTEIQLPTLESDTFDPADLGDLIQSDLDDLEGLDQIDTDDTVPADVITDIADSTSDEDLSLTDTTGADWGDSIGIELPDAASETTETKESDDSIGLGFIESFDNEESVAMPIDDLVEDQAVTDLIALDDLDLEEIPEVDEEEPARPSGLGLGVATVAGSAAVAAITGESDNEPGSELENLDGDIRAVAATRSYTSVAKAEPKIDSDLNELFIETNAPDPSSSRNFTIPILILLVLAVLALLWWMTDDSANNPTNSEDAAVTTVDPADTTDASTATTEDTAPQTTAEPETTTQAPTTAPEPTIPPTVWSLVGVESGTSQFTELGAPLGLQAALEQTVDANGNPLEFTLFAPSDEAISGLTQEQRDSLAQDVTAAETLIDYHFVEQRLTPELLREAAGGELMTRAGLPIFVDTEDGDVVLNGSTRIDLAAFEAGNGNIIVIDQVLQQPTINTVLNLGDIQFEVISSVITDAGKAELQKAVDYFNDNPDANALIEGHTDTDGDADANLRLSDRRARAVREFLIEQGIDGSRLVARGFGEAEPVIIDGAEDKNASRRIEFTLQ